jgi:hypothetical protein
MPQSRGGINGYDSQMIHAVEKKQGIGNKSTTTCVIHCTRQSV